MYDLVLLILRVCLGIVFMAHGLQVAFGLFSGPGINGFASMLVGMGFKPAVFWSYLSAYTELIGGLCLIFGIFTRFAAVSILIFMIVAVLKVHLAKGFFIQAGGYEYNFVLICICLALIFSGPGKFALLKKF
ncbi:MAG: DoxX family protein [Candidatus Omnitrophica bacterium]|nr:DoxX family protein [Candidatus Omnitrophota bacterium]MDD5653286.1 DoxX family protein [Candidatus Omnitrophota bacterium]